jgi:hypothetical protein
VTETGFAPKEVIPQEVCRLEILAADKVDTYGLQLGLKLKVVGGEHDGHIFTDYTNRDEDTGQIKQGSKAWSIFEACLGKDFHKPPGVSIESLVGKPFMGQVTQTKTGGRNKVEFGTIGPVRPEAVKIAPKPDAGDHDDDMFSETGKFGTAGTVETMIRGPILAPGRTTRCASTTAREEGLMDISRGEMVEKKIDAMIERWSRQKDPDEEHELWKESVKRYNARRQEELRAQWW